jgi:hypothetical protein
MNFCPTDDPKGTVERETSPISLDDSIHRWIGG